VKTSRMMLIFFYDNKIIKL